MPAWKWPVTGAPSCRSRVVQGPGQVVDDGSGRHTTRATWPNACAVRRCTGALGVRVAPECVQVVAVRLLHLWPDLAHAEVEEVDGPAEARGRAEQVRAAGRVGHRAEAAHRQSGHGTACSGAVVMFEQRAQFVQVEGLPGGRAAPAVVPPVTVEPGPPAIRHHHEDVPQHGQFLDAGLTDPGLVRLRLEPAVQEVQHGPGVAGPPPLPAVRRQQPHLGGPAEGGRVDGEVDLAGATRSSARTSGPRKASRRRGSERWNSRAQYGGEWVPA